MSDEKKISLNELEDLLEESESNSTSRINFATIFATLVLNWQYFLFSLIILVCGALLYLSAATNGSLRRMGRKNEQGGDCLRRFEWFEKFEWFERF